MKRGSLLRTFAGLAAAGGGALAAYVWLIRPWHLRWGATDDEVRRPMLLDEEVTRPTYVTNRAITINALPEDIWPWLAQMGELPRGGFYSYEWIERLQGMRVRSAGRILREFQQPEVGDVLDRRGNMVVKAIEPNRTLVLGPPPLPDLEATWALSLYPVDEGRTRLVSRVRGRLGKTPKGLLWMLLLDPGQFIMERKMLLEIKRRAESLARQRGERLRALPDADHSGW